MNDCWAACLGDCSGKISREHIVTAGLFLDDKITVQGPPWCRNEPKEIGLAALTKKNLCTKHNSDLSGVDNAGISSMNVLREATELTNLRIKYKITRPRIKRFQIDGRALERWFLKTFINIAFKQAYPIGRDSAQPWIPSCDLVEIAFGQKQFEPKAGLYFLGEPGEQIESKEGLRAMTFTNETDALVGAMFYFWGFRFFLYLDQDGPGERFHSIRSTGWSGRSQPMYHLKDIRATLGKPLSHVIEIRW
jgi:hypothetical protein